MFNPPQNSLMSTSPETLTIKDSSLMFRIPMLLEEIQQLGEMDRLSEESKSDSLLQLSLTAFMELMEEV